MSRFRPPLDVTDLVPHRPPMLLLDQLIELDEGGAVAVARARPDHPLLDELGQVDPLASIELIAQTAAAMEGAVRRGTGGGSGQLPGVVVGVRELVLDGAARPGETIRVEIRRGPASRIFQTIRGKVVAEGRPVAEGELKLVVQDAARLGPAPASLADGTALGRGGGAPTIHPLTGTFEAKEGLLVGTFELSASCPAFQGHFPTHPILPAAAVAALAAAPVRAAASRRLRVARVTTARFVRALYPGSTVVVTCGNEGTGDSWAAKVDADGEAAASLCFELTRGERTGEE